MQQALNDWQRAMLEALANVDAPGAARVRESLPHLWVTAVCSCGCPSFNVRDSRFPEVPHELEHFSNGATPDWEGGFVLWLGSDRRPIAVDAVIHGGGKSPPDPATVTASAAV